jgi:hypothetical protein
MFPVIGWWSDDYMIGYMELLPAALVMDTVNELHFYLPRNWELASQRFDADKDVLVVDP